MVRLGSAVPDRRTRRPQAPVVGQLYYLTLDLDYGLHCGTPACADRVVVLRYTDHWRPLCGACLDLPWEYVPGPRKQATVVVRRGQQVLLVATPVPTDVVYGTVAEG